MLEITGSTVKKYIRGLTLAGCVTGSTKSYYQYDAHGNVVQLINASGVVAQSYDYDAFGNQFSPSLTDSNMFRYSGEYFDKETDFYYLRARQYSPAIGRFTQEDPYRGEYASPLSLNLYTYCYNDPVRYVDLTGHLGWDTFFDIWSLSASVTKFLFNRTRENLVSVAIDAVALAIPYVPSAVVSTAVEYTTKLVSEAYQSVIDDVFDDFKFKN